MVVEYVRHILLPLREHKTSSTWFHCTWEKAEITTAGQPSQPLWVLLQSSLHNQIKPPDTSQFLSFSFLFFFKLALSYHGNFILKQPQNCLTWLRQTCLLTWLFYYILNQVILFIYSSTSYNCGTQEIFTFILSVRRKLPYPYFAFLLIWTRSHISKWRQMTNDEMMNAHSLKILRSIFFFGMLKQGLVSSNAVNPKVKRHHTDFKDSRR